MDTEKRKELEILFRKIIGNLIKEKREALNLTQESVAERVGCSTKHFGRLERGEKTAGSFTLALIQLELDVNTNDYLSALRKAMKQLDLDE